MTGGLLNYSTKIPTARTAGEVIDLLAQAGADEVMMTYLDRRPAGVKFSLAGPAGKVAFALPVNLAGVRAVMAEHLTSGAIRSGNGGLSRAVLTSAEQAERVAWRIAKDWLEVQLALVAASMASLDEIMLPFMITPGGATLYQRYVETGLTALEAGNG